MQIKTIMKSPHDGPCDLHARSDLHRKPVTYRFYVLNLTPSAACEGSMSISLTSDGVPRGERR